MEDEKCSIYFGDREYGRLWEGRASHPRKKGFTTLPMLPIPLEDHEDHRDVQYVPSLSIKEFRDNMAYNESFKERYFELGLDMYVEDMIMVRNALQGCPS